MPAPRAPAPRKNIPRVGTMCNLFTLKLDGGSGTPVILASGGDRHKMVDYARGTNGITDDGNGDHSIHLAEKYAQVDICAFLNGTAQTITSVTYDATNHEIDVNLSADTALILTLICVGYLTTEHV